MLSSPRKLNKNGKLVQVVVAGDISSLVILIKIGTLGWLVVKKGLQNEMNATKTTNYKCAVSALFYLTEYRLKQHIKSLGHKQPRGQRKTKKNK